MSSETQTDLHFADVLLFVILGVAFVLALAWTIRSALHEFSYPLDSDRKWTREGSLTLGSIYVAAGWAFALMAVFAKIPGATRADSAATFGLIGIVIVGALRLHSLSRSFVQGRVFVGVPTATEVALTILAGMLGSAFVISGVGDLSGPLREISPMEAPNYFNPQPQGSVLLFGSIFTAVGVELIWGFYSHTKSYRRVAIQVAKDTVDKTLASPEGAFALQLYARAAATCKVYDTAGFRRLSRPFDKDKSLAQVRSVAEMLVSTGLLIPVGSGGYRRHPHFHSDQRERAEMVASALRAAQELSLEDVERLLTLRTGAYVLQRVGDFPQAVQQIVRLSGKSATEVLPDLLDATLDDMRRADLQGRDWVLLTYLRNKYWDDMSIAAIARELNYSREHLSRIASKDCLLLFRRFLINRISTDYQVSQSHTRLLESTGLEPTLARVASR